MFDLPKYGQGTCLTRVSSLLLRLGIDTESLSKSSVVVAGSNGKGSTATYLSSIGKECGLKTGTFTSPHLFDFSERFKIDGKNIDPKELNELVRLISATIRDLQSEEALGGFGAFEAQ